jgi:parvulin-like peptidyl-prolyl isomerase
VRSLFSRTFDWSDIDTERRNAILVVGGISIVVIVAFVIIGYGYYTDKLSASNDTVLTVGSRDIKYDYLERRLLNNVKSSDLASSTAFTQLVGTVLSNIEREEVLRQAAKSKGLEVTPDELDAELRQELGVNTDSSREVLGTRLAAELKLTGYSLSQYEDIAKAKVIEAKFRDQFAAQVPAQAEQVDVRLVEVATQAKALELKQRLDNGEQMAVIAATESIHISKSNAGELGWVPRGTLEPDLEDKIFSQQVDTISDVIEEPDGFYIVQLLGKETRPVDDAAKKKVVDYSLTSLLDETRTAVGTNFSLTQNQISKLATAAQAALSAGG